jgi:tetratricopeptide (TPR) repeat protein
LAATYRVDLENFGWSDDREERENREMAVDLARRALRAAADDPGVLGRAAMVLGRFGEDIDAALALVERALALNPSFALWLVLEWLAASVRRSGRLGDTAFRDLHAS